MESLKLKLEQSYTNKDGVTLHNELNLNIEQINSSFTDEQIIGTCLDEIFAYLELQKNVGSKAIKLNRPIILTIHGVGIKSIDFGILDIKTINTLKCGNKAKIKRAFSWRIVSSLNYMLRERKVKTIQELFAELEAQIELEAQSK